MTDMEQNNIDDNEALSKKSRNHLVDVRRALLKLHKAILEVERAAYEQANGKVESPHRMLELVMHDPWFGWFRPISETVVQIDEMLEAEEPATEGNARVLLRDLRSLLNPAEEGEEFGVKYKQMLQVAPEIILAHAEISKLL